MKSYYHIDVNIIHLVLKSYSSLKLSSMFSVMLQLDHIPRLGVLILNKILKGEVLPSLHGTATSVLQARQGTTTAGVTYK